MGSPEQVGEVTPLHEHVVTHLRVLNPLIKDSAVNKKLMLDVPKIIQNLSQLDATGFFESELGWAKGITSHLGPRNIARNGVTFGLQTKNDDNLLVRLYLPAGIESESVREEIHHCLKSGLPRLFWFPQRKKLINSAIAGEPNKDTRYFSSAEILVRTMAHLVTTEKPFAQPLPTVLIDKQSQPVGYTLGFDRLPTQVKNAEVEIIDTFFDHWPGDVYGLAESSGEIAMGFYEQLKGINCLPYVERGQNDLENMLLLDSSEEFLTFNRIGYSTSKIGWV